ncbi:hypothetical protein GGI24_002956, partial [Coemansia furcata]
RHSGRGASHANSVVYNAACAGTRGQAGQAQVIHSLPWQGPTDSKTQQDRFPD